MTMIIERPAVELVDELVDERPIRSTQLPYLHAIAAYVAVRMLGVVVLAVMATDKDLPLLDRLTAWDGLWYLKLAEVNYGGMTGTLDAAGQPFAAAPYAFFPLYPMLTGGLASVAGVSTIAAGLIVSLAAGIAAACALIRIARRVDARPATGVILAALFAAAPMSIALSMTYTEALFCALAAWALVGVLERNWWMAGTCTLFAGLTRSTATVLIAVVMLAALIAVCRGRDRWAALTAFLAAPVGLLGYWAFVAAQTGSVTGWHDIELRGWNTRWDFGAESVEWVSRILLGRGSVMETTTVLVVLGAMVLAVLSARLLPWPLVAYGIGVVCLVLGTAGFPFMKGRFLLPGMIVLLIPMAIGLAGRRTSTAAVTVVGLALVGGWFSAHGLTAWISAI